MALSNYRLVVAVGGCRRETGNRKGCQRTCSSLSSLRPTLSLLAIWSVFLLYSYINKVLVNVLKLHQIYIHFKTGREGNSFLAKGYQPIKSYFLYCILRRKCSQPLFHKVCGDQWIWWTDLLKINFSFYFFWHYTDYVFSPLINFNCKTIAL